MSDRVERLKALLREYQEFAAGKRNVYSSGPELDSALRNAAPSLLKCLEALEDIMSHKAEFAGPAWREITITLGDYENARAALADFEREGE